MDFLDVFEANEQRFFQFNKVYVIENLSPPDTQTGFELYRDVLERIEYKHRWLRSEYSFFLYQKRTFRRS